MKEFDVNLTNMTYKDGLFNKKINAKPITFKHSLASVLMKFSTEL